MTLMCGGRGRYLERNVLPWLPKQSQARAGCTVHSRFHPGFQVAAMSGGTGGHPTFRGFLKASGQAEVWDDTDKKKFDQFGWRTRTNESAYSSDTLIGNWNEEQFDVSRLAQPRCLPSQYDHYFETTYRQAYSKSPPRVPESLRYSRGNEPSAFPAHQPVLDPPQLKQNYNSFLTSSMEAYGVPEGQRGREGGGEEAGGITHGETGGEKREEEGEGKCDV